MAIPNQEEVRQAVEEAGFQTAPFSHPELEWGFQAKTGQIPVIVAKPKGAHLIDVVFPVGIDPEHQKALKGMKPRDRDDLYARLKIALLSSRVTYQLQPPGATVFEQIQVNHAVFSEDVTPARLYHIIGLVRDAGLKSAVILKQGCDSKSGTIPVVSVGASGNTQMDDLDVNMVYTSAHAAQRIYELAEERGVETKQIVDEMLKKFDTSN